MTNDVKTKDDTMSTPLPRTEDGFLDTSAAYGTSWMVEIIYNTDTENKWVGGDSDDSNRTYHGPFTESEAREWMESYPDDTDVYDMCMMVLNNVRPAVTA